MRKVAISTVDNPFNPINEFDKWYNYDIEKGYFTAELLARRTVRSDVFTDKLNNAFLEAAIDTIIESDSSAKYVKVVEED